MGKGEWSCIEEILLSFGTVKFNSSQLFNINNLATTSDSRFLSFETLLS